MAIVWCVLPVRNLNFEISVHRFHDTDIPNRYSRDTRNSRYRYCTHIQLYFFQLDESIADTSQLI